MPVKGTHNPGPVRNALPPAKPADVGVNVTVSATLCPALRVKGNVAPLTENALPVVCSAVIFTARDRAFVSTSGKLALPPTVVCPKERLDGLAVTAWLSTPVPPICQVRAELEMLLENSIVPGIHPVVAGVKLILTSTL